jgi:hypothetical protein
MLVSAPALACVFVQITSIIHPPPARAVAETFAGAVGDRTQNILCGNCAIRFKLVYDEKKAGSAAIVPQWVVDVTPAIIPAIHLPHTEMSTSKRGA